MSFSRSNAKFYPHPNYYGVFLKRSKPKLNAFVNTRLFAFSDFIRIKIEFL